MRDMPRPRAEIVPTAERGGSLRLCHAVASSSARLPCSPPSYLYGSGFWQLARLHEKVRRNVAIAAQQREPPVQFASLPRDTAAAHYRRATVIGVFDYANELVLSSRTHQGSPGVELLTPLRLAGSDTAVLVNRGWVYSPDGASVDRSRWRERDSATVAAYVQLYAPDAGTTAAASGSAHRAARQPARDRLERIPYPIAPYYLVADRRHRERASRPP